MYVEKEYKAKLIIIDINKTKNIAKFKTIVLEEDERIIIEGEAVIKYP